MTVSLHDRLHRDLVKTVEMHPDASLVKTDETTFQPDLVARSGDRVLLFQIKTGDPALPLPGSANAQMLIFKDLLKKSLERSIEEQQDPDIRLLRFTSPGNLKIVPVLVTNYLIDDSDFKELRDAGIKVVAIRGSSYNSRKLSDDLEKIIKEHPG
jgi:hypothetical protein